MEKNQSIYTRDKNDNDSNNAGMHMDASIEAGWGDFPPIVNIHALSLTFSGDEAYKNRQDYKEEVKMLTDIKTKADYCIQNGMLYQSNANNGMVNADGNTILSDFYVMQLIQDESTDIDLENCRQNLVNTYRSKVIEAIGSLNNPIPVNSPTPEKDWRNALNAVFTTPILSEMMRDSGYPLINRDIDLRVIYSLIDQHTLGDFCKISEGGLYRTIRRSAGFRKALNKCYNECKTLNAELDKIKEEIIQPALDQALNQYREKNCSEVLKLFSDCFVTGHIEFIRDFDKDRLFIYFYDSPKDTKNSIVWAEGTLMRTPEYEKTYFIYGAFTAFYHMSIERGLEWINSFRNQVNDEMEEMGNEGVLTTREKKRIQSILLMDPNSLSDDIQSIHFTINDNTIPDFNEITFPNTPPISRVNAAEEINTLVSEYPCVKFKHFSDLPFSDNNNQILNSTAGQIMTFYDKLRNIINGR